MEEGVPEEQETIIVTCLEGPVVPDIDWHFELYTVGAKPLDPLPKQYV